MNHSESRYPKDREVTIGPDGTAIIGPTVIEATVIGPFRPIIPGDYFLVTGVEVEPVEVDGHHKAKFDVRLERAAKPKNEPQA